MARLVETLAIAPAPSSAKVKTSTHRIVGTGLFALDVIVRRDGSTAPPTLGGSAGNVLWILGALGWKTTPVGVLGDDSASRMVQSDFERVDADTRFLLRSSGRSTPVIFQHQLELTDREPGATHRFTFTCPACGTKRGPLWDDESALADADSPLPSAGVFFLDRPTRLGVSLAERYAEDGAVVVFEPSTMGDDLELFARAVRCASIVKYANDRIADLSNFDLRPHAVEIQTCGPDGLRFRASSLDDSWIRLGAYELPFMQDTAGAGDWCTAGLIFDLFGRSPELRTEIDNDALARALAFGQVLSTLNCMAEGARGLLSAWTPGRVIRAARDLSEARVNGLRIQQPQCESRVSEPRLNIFADEVTQWFTATVSNADGVGCCPAP